MKKNKRYRLCFVNRLLQDIYISFDDINQLLNYTSLYQKSILYIKYCYDSKEDKFLYNYLSFDRKD